MVVFRKLPAALAAAPMALFGGDCDPGDLPPPPPTPPSAGQSESSNGGQGDEGAEADAGAWSFALSSGFRPDPHVVDGTTGGEIAAATLDSSCHGWVSREPDHVFDARDAFTELRFLVNAGDRDVTLVVERPDGTFECTDDVEGDRPVLESYVQPGEHAIRIGSFEQGEQAPYRLAITELEHLSAESIGAPGSGPPGGDGNSNFGTVALGTGFEPNPTVVRGTGGGLVDASARSAQCSGWISDRPDHVLTTNGDFDRLRLVVVAKADTTLVVERPDGTFVCNDDGEDRDPIVDAPFDQGRYRVWVGAYRSGDNPEYRLAFTTRPELGPSDVPAEPPQR